MGWRERKQDTYVNNGKTTTTTITPAEAPDFWRVTQFKKYLGSQGEMNFEGVFKEDEAEAAFVDLVSDAHTEIVEAPGSSRVLAGIIDGDDDA